MDFVAVLDQVITLLRQRGRLTYRTLRRQFELDDTVLEDLEEELIYGQRLAVDEDERVLVWMGDTAAPTPLASGPRPALDTIQARSPLTYTPPYLAEKILTSRIPRKASASRSPCCLPTSKAPWSCWRIATRKRLGSSLIPSWNA